MKTSRGIGAAPLKATRHSSKPIWARTGANASTAPASMAFSTCAWRSGSAASGVGRGLDVDRVGLEQRVEAQDVVGREAVWVIEHDDVSQRRQLGPHLENALEEIDVLDDGEGGVGVRRQVLDLVWRGGVVDRDR